MARVQNTLIGRASGSVGQVVFLTWKLINITRAKPVSVANPQTQLQTQQRFRYAFLLGLYQALYSILAIGLQNRNRKMTLLNFFWKLNMSNYFQNNGTNIPDIVYQNLKLSYGLMPTQPMDIYQAQEGNSIVIMVLGNIPQTSVSSSDLLYAVAINYTNGSIGVSAGINTRTAGFKSIDLPEVLQSGDVVGVYTFFADANRRIISDTFVNLITVS